MTKEEQDSAAFSPWLARQDRDSVPGRLFLRLCADLCVAKWPRMPESLHEVKAWAAGPRAEDAEVQQWLPVTIKYWKTWLASTPTSSRRTK